MLAPRGVFGGLGSAAAVYRPALDSMRRPGGEAAGALERLACL